MIDPTDLTLAEGDRRRLIVWSAACAARLLPIFSAERPDDGRLRDAIAGAAAFADGAVGVGAMRTLAFACHAAARDAVSPEATAVARAVGQAAAVAHMAAHSREIPRYTRKALAGDALVAELAWQREQVPADLASYVFG
ncbi:MULTISPECIES: putative immunity protein [Clavibacter]|uniref:putative immunity protein n=1 Tax=Clavibacter TaxID=1573 RepID=UPI000A3CFE3D|nr:MULTISPECIES: hypothetical protein [Clavibacter]KAF0259873.1 hypothetical protein DOU02_00910 [Clavibacter michiganensis subsp. michiganensis]MBF4621406.1 hypothetical protein [Clavibacter sp. VKM Ac-2542]MBW8026248.1 hypothetical protein [Clavibacter michiganensis subsp. michiganensis]MDO4032094.1 hypothetical protein [Clavibacter michiganensis]MDO4081312.1 hypothetical protein [Clavibacter michiganensis]